MKIIKNEATIERNKKIGNWISISALLVLGGGMYLSFSKPDWFGYSILCLIVGYLLTQVGMYMGNRWGRSPRPDEKLDAGLKGLHSDFALYHYVTPASHLLVGPAGVWALLPYHQAGKVEFVKNRWKLSGGGFFQNYMRIFGQEGIGRPDIEANSEINSVKKFLEKNLNGSEIPEIQALLVFTHESAELIPNDSSVPALKLKQVKEFLRQKSKTRAISVEKMQELNRLFGEA
ncbi:MAG: hypothetical protein IT311_06030 [Anaerolineales bacterium]|nr:hypothetical protein [Anaerolineales bacterium]MCZ2123600.1 hypothetical protein [Anaerolineales bacterium]